MQIVKLVKLSDSRTHSQVFTQAYFLILFLSLRCSSGADTGSAVSSDCLPFQ